MSSPSRKSRIFPRISTMPRQQTEAGTYLDIYKLVNERKRLEQELVMLDERRDRIQNRLTELSLAITEMEEQAKVLRQQDVTGPAPRTGTKPKASPPPTAEGQSYETMDVEY